MVPKTVTLDTSHFDRSLLNAAAPKNMAPISCMLDTSYFDMSSLNVAAL